MFKKRKLKAGVEANKRRLSSSSGISHDTGEDQSPVTLKKAKASASDKNYKMAKVTPNDKVEATDHEGDQPETSSNAEFSERDSAVMEVSKPAQVGPLKAAPMNIRTVTITDFQPDVCKDFLQTGYCGYGDTCKFLHIRDESRQKKPVEREWENVTKPQKEKKADQDIPFKCPLCKKDYDSPVETDCGHIFCKSCFLQRFKSKKRTTCFICGKETNGVFLPVSTKKLDAILAQK